MFNTEKYVKLYSNYFALALYEITGGLLHLYVENRYDAVADVWKDSFAYAYVEIAPSVYVDAFGLFRHRDERLKYFASGAKSRGLSFESSKAAKDVLSNLGVTSTNVELKREVREFLRNNMLLLNLNVGGMVVPFALYGKTERGRVRSLLFQRYDNATRTVMQHVTTFSDTDVSNKLISSEGYIPQPRWYYKK